MVDVAHEVIVTQEDCGTCDGIWVQAVYKGEKEVVPLVDHIVGRVASEDIAHPLDASKVIVCADQEIKEDQAKTIDQAGIKRVKIRSVLTCETKHGVCIRCYGHNLATGSMVKLGEAVGIIAAQSIGEPGTQLTMRTFHTGGTASQEDITRGLPSVIELLEARPPITSQIQGTVSAVKSFPQEQYVVIEDPDTQVQWMHFIPADREVLVKKEDHVTEGQPLTSGHSNLPESSKVGELQEFQERFVENIQRIYRPNKVTISDKHIEVILRQMLRKVHITEPGDTTFVSAQCVDKVDFEEENQHVEKMGRKSSEAEPVLLGITKAALQSKSFLSAASFQDTSQVLVEAALLFKVDELRGLKGKVITGGLIPAALDLTPFANSI